MCVGSTGIVVKAAGAVAALVAATDPSMPVGEPGGQERKEI